MIQLRVLLEDEHLLAIDKPAGVHTAPLSPGETGTLLEAVIARYREVERLPGRKPVEPGLLHRLDRETSGLVIVARSAFAFERLLSQFETDAVRKEYLAACHAHGLAVARLSVGDRLGIASRFAPRGPGGGKVRVVLEHEGRTPHRNRTTADSYSTEVEVVTMDRDLLLVRCLITRGFRHQIRAHLAHLGLPILGDPLYGVAVPEGAPDRMYLHASAVELTHPVSGDMLRIESPAPEEFGSFFASLRGRPTA